MIYESLYVSLLGRIRLRSDGKALTELRFVGQKYDEDLSDAVQTDDLPVFAAAKRWLDAYFASLPLPAPPPLAPKGTAFQLRCWELLQSIPFGQTMTYGELAAKLRSSARAVGGAAARNPILLLIPCHRVIGADGSLTGFAAGMGRKGWLREREVGIRQ